MFEIIEDKEDQLSAKLSSGIKYSKIRQLIIIVGQNLQFFYD